MTIVLEVLMNSRAYNTTKKILELFSIMGIWCDQFSEILTIPADETYIILYLLNLLQKQFSVIKSSLYAIKYFYKILSYNDLCASELTNFKRILH